MAYIARAVAEIGLWITTATAATEKLSRVDVRGRWERHLWPRHPGDDRAGKHRLFLVRSGGMGGIRQHQGQRQQKSRVLGEP